jgi:hypothetical protein
MFASPEMDADVCTEPLVDVPAAPTEQIFPYDTMEERWIKQETRWMERACAELDKLMREGAFERDREGFFDLLEAFEEGFIGRYYIPPEPLRITSTP